jgi:hypothetical protein
MLDTEAVEDAGFSVLWLGLVMVPLECLVVTVGDEDDDRVVSFSSANHVSCRMSTESVLLASFHDIGG